MQTDQRKGVSIEVKYANAMSFEADVLVLKFAQSHYGLDKMVAFRLADSGIEESRMSPGEGQHSLVDAEGVLRVRRVLFMGVRQLYEFGYGEIRQFAATALAVLAENAGRCRHVCMTLHGAGYGLDEAEAFAAEIAGIIDTVTAGRAPRDLARVTIVDRDGKRVARMNAALDRILPRGRIEIDISSYLNDLAAGEADNYRSVGFASETKPHVFVAMPFREDMDDLYHYGILNSVKDAGYLCERADLSAYTGDVMSWVKKRIRSASLLIADLTHANPNVYLEVGYAWGVGVPAVLIVQDADDLKFDVAGQRCLVYRKIMDLERVLKSELEALEASATGH